MTLAEPGSSAMVSLRILAVGCLKSALQCDDMYYVNTCTTYICSKYSSYISLGLEYGMRSRRSVWRHVPLALFSARSAATFRRLSTSRWRPRSARTDWTAEVGPALGSQGGMSS